MEAGKAWPAGETAEAVIEIEELGIRERVQCVGSSGAEATCGGTGTANPVSYTHLSGAETCPCQRDW